MEQQTASPSAAADGRDGTESAAFASGSQVRSQQEFSPTLRRSSSDNLSNYSSVSGTHGGIAPGLRRSRTRQFSRSSTDFLPPMPTIDEDNLAEKHEEHSHWHAFSLIFVALPAIAGLFFENGSAVMTDLLLLSLGCLFLYWSVKWPFQWYQSARARVFLVMEEPEVDDDFAVEESIQGEDTEGAEKLVTPESTPEKKRSKPSQNERKQGEAIESLKNLELIALASCFISPMAVAYLLHAIRPYLSRPSGGLVSNSNLTLFVLAAEVRPVMHVLKLIEERTLHLQKIITEPPVPSSSAATGQVEDLLRRISALEAFGANKDMTSTIPNEDPKIPSQPVEQVDPAAVTTSIKASIQPQLDALNRAVRRYEKRATTQSVVLEARLHALDSRVNDALSLAAAASRIAQQRPVGLITWITQSVNYLIASIVSGAWSLVLAPWRLIAVVYAYLLEAVGPSAKATSKKKLDASAAKGRSPEKSPAGTGTAGYVITRGKLAAKA